MVEYKKMQLLSVFVDHFALLKWMVRGPNTFTTQSAISIWPANVAELLFLPETSSEDMGVNFLLSRSKWANDLPEDGQVNLT